MKYTIVWTDKATNELAEIWLQSANRSAVTDATNTLDRVLADNPLSDRHEVFRGFGTAIRVPVGVDFGVDARNRLVIVISAWQVFEDLE
jgi:hypothetical protein